MAKTKKALALILCLVMCLSMLPTWAVAEEVNPAEEEAVAELQGDNPAESSPTAVFVLHTEPEGAYVRVYSLDENGAETDAYPDETGAYILAPGEYHYDVSAEGYQARQGERIQLTAVEAPTEITVVLEPEVQEPAPEEVASEAETFEEEPVVETAPVSEPEGEEMGEESFQHENADAGSPLEQTQTVVTEEPDNTEPDIGEAPNAQETQTAEQEGVEQEQAEQENYVTVIFRTTPEDAEVTLYTKAENGEKTVIDPEEDGSYLLSSGEYYYDVIAEGYDPIAEKSVVLDEKAVIEPIEIKVELLLRENEVIHEDINENSNLKAVEDTIDNTIVATLAASKPISDGYNNKGTVNSTATGGIKTAIEAVKTKFPEEKYWNHYANTNALVTTDYKERTPNSVTDYPCKIHGVDPTINTYCCNVFDGASQCQGFARKIFYEIYGHTVSKNQTGSIKSDKNIQEGDFVSINNGGHYGIVYSINKAASTFTLIECNANSYVDTRCNCIINYGRYNYKFSQINSYIHADNYDTILGSSPTTVTITSKANDTHSTEITDTEANISRYVYISGASFGNATDFGLELFDASGSTKLAAKSDGKPIVSSGGYVDAWYKIGKGQEINYTLTPDTTYKYRFYTKIGGTTYCSDFRSFTTTGFTVSYNANGGSGAPAAQKCATGANVTLSGTKPTRGNSSATGYTVTLNANGGNVSPASLTAARTTSYTFKNWNSAANGSGTAYNAGASYTGKTSITLFAQWNSSTTTSAVTLPVPTKAGHTFNGWATSSNAASGIKGSYTPTGNVTLYATWTPEKYTVTYHANGGTGAPAAQTKTYGTALTISSTKPTRANSTGTGFTVLLNANGGTGTPSSLVAKQTVTYSFKNWNTASDGSKTSYNPGGSYTTNAAAVLYAQWTSKTTTETVELPTPSREGYSFGGWATSSSATSGSFGKYTPSGNVTLYAVWTKNQSPVRFTDVSDPALYFYNPVYWAVDQGITTGRTATTFDPYGYCTRGHIVLFLWRAMGKPEPTISNPFADVSPDDSFYKAVLWAYEKGITTGQTPTTFGPWKSCTRGQIVTFLWRAMGQTEPSIKNPFTDVKDTDGFYKAVLWAVQNGITTGKTQTTFEPWTTCTRGQAVTFLYRAMN